MNFIQRNKKTGEYSVLRGYPRSDMAPVSGLNGDIEIYVIEDLIPGHSADQGIRFSKYTFTESPHSELTHLKIAIKSYDVFDIERQEDEFQLLKEAVSILSENSTNERLIEITTKIKKDGNNIDSGDPVGRTT
jgi:hypothetical protein